MRHCSPLATEVLEAICINRLDRAYSHFADRRVNNVSIHSPERTVFTLPGNPDVLGL
jgi:hypothetical protein